MSADTAVSFIALTAGVVLLAVLLPRYWRHHITALDRPRPWWFLGDETWRAGVRIMPTAVIGGWILIAIGLAMWLEPPGATRSPWAAPLGLGMLVSFLLLLTIWFWNRPKFLVPPYLRGDPGMWSDMFGSKRRPHRKSKRPPR